MTNHKTAREALSRIDAIEGVTDGPWKHKRIFDQAGTPHGDEITGPNDALICDDVAHLQDATHIAACDPATMKAIAALVDAQDAQIAALRGALGLTADQAIRAEIPDGYRDHVAPEMPDDWHKGFDAAIEGARTALTDTAATAAAIRTMRGDDGQ